MLQKTLKGMKKRKHTAVKVSSEEKTKKKKDFEKHWRIMLVVDEKKNLHMNLIRR